MKMISVSAFNVVLVLCFGLEINAFHLESFILMRRISTRKVTNSMSPFFMTSNPDVKVQRTNDPPKELVEDALQKAEEIIKDAGGCIDSISFGAAWKKKYPDFSRERFEGTSITSFNKLIRVISPCFDIYLLSLLVDIFDA